MTNEQYKAKTLVGLDPTEPAIGGLAPWTHLRWSPLGALMRAQDTVPATSRRIVASWSLSGAQDWAQPPGTVDPGVAAPTGHVYPTDTTWRTLGTYEAHVTPGCELRAQVLYCPAGLTQFDTGGGVNFSSAGAWAELRVRATWTNGVNTDGPNDHTMTMEGSTKGTYGGLANTGAGQNWNDLREHQIVNIRPAEYLTDPAVATNFSEWSDVLLQVQVRGGARVVAVCIFEFPRAHVTLHSNDGLTSVHAIPPSNSPLTSFPQTKAADGTTYEEHRFGTTRLLQVAERQSERLGPRPFAFSTWNESSHNTLTETDADPLTTASSSFVDLLNSTITAYYNNNPGWLIAGSNAQLWRLCDSRLIARGRFAVIPVRVRVDGSRTAGTGTVRVQSGPYEWVDVDITGARDWYEAVGYLRSQVCADHNLASCQVFGRCSGGGTLSVYGVSVDFGQWAS